MEIRVAGLEDVAAVVRLERGIAEVPHWAEAEYVTVIGRDGAVLFVATVEGVVVGFAVARIVCGEAELESIAVGDTSRRRGVGLALCRRVMEWCGMEGAVSVGLEVRSLSTGAQRLYEGFGFRVIGRRLGYYRQPDDDALLMQCELMRGKADQVAEV